MRVMALAPAPDPAPSTRYRLEQLKAPLAARGIELELRPFLTREDYGQLYRPERELAKAGIVIRGFRRRRRDIAAAAGYDVILVHREVAPFGNELLLRGLMERGRPLVFDFDDAVFLPPQGGHPLLRRLRRPERETGALCRAARRVLAGNGYLADFALRARGEREGDAVRVLPTVVDTKVYRPASAADRASPSPSRGEPEEVSGEVVKTPPGKATVGWIGTHTTIPYLESIYPYLESVRERVDFRTLVVGNREPLSAPQLDMDFRLWRAEKEVAYLNEMDVGVYPLPDDPWTRGKCGFKAIQYLACGVPVVASPVGVLREIVIPGETGLLADGPEEWVTHLTALLEDPSLRARLGGAGRVLVQEGYSVEAVIDELVRALTEAAE